MSTFAPKVRFFTGAPTAADLDWTKDDLLNQFLPAFARFLQCGPSFSSGKTSISSSIQSSGDWPRWRALPVKNNHKDVVEHSKAASHSDMEVEKGNAAPDISFVSVGTVDLNPGNDDEFLEVSFAVYNSVAISQLQSPELEGGTTASESFMSRLSTESSFISIDSLDSDRSQPPLLGLAMISLPSPIVNLRTIPKADDLIRIAPQTVTVNLVVGIISIMAPRTVQLRRSKNTMDIVELIVGDDTRANFSISIWLVPRPSQQDQLREDSMRTTLENLRTRDLVTFQNVALHVWQGQVYGQSLSRRISRNETKVELLGRDGGIDKRLLDKDLTVQNPQFAKVKRVADWIIAFLGVSALPAKDKRLKMANITAKRNFSHAQYVELPPDTQ
jgi:hypothetical protein